MDILSYLLGYAKGKTQGGQNNESSNAIETDVFPLQTVDGFSYEEPYQWYYSMLSMEGIALQEGETYYVNWDGTVYTCQGIAATLDDLSFVYLGNGSRLGYPGNDEPFGIIFNVGVGYLQAVTFDNSDSSHDIRIYQSSVSSILPLTVTANGKYTAPAGSGYSPVNVSVATGGTVDFPFALEEILPPTELTFQVGACSSMPMTPAAIVADTAAVKNMNIIKDGDSGLVIWNGTLYAVYAGERNSAPVQITETTTTFSITNAVGNIGIPSKIFAASVIEDTKSAGKSNEPFLIVANSSWGFVVAIPENSTVLTHTVQIFKFVNQ